MDNAYRGEASLDFGGGDVRALRYTWSAIVELRATLGDDWETKINEALISLDLAALSKILAVGLRETWPDVSAGAVMGHSPPISDAAAAIRLALHRAFFGAKTLPEVAAERSANPLKRAIETGRKIMSWLLSRRRLQPA